MVDRDDQRGIEESEEVMTKMLSMRERVEEAKKRMSAIAKDNYIHGSWSGSTQDTDIICKPGCPICGGYGVYRLDVPVGDVNFGKVQRCPNMDLGKVLGSRTGLEADERGWGWGKVWNVGDASRGVDVVKRVLSRGHGWVYMWGDYGQAKTLILKVATAWWLNERGKAAYVRMSEVLDNMRAAYDEDESAEKRLATWSGMPFLAIDEFDRMRETEYAIERRFVLMDRRYENALRRKSVSIMAANTDPSTLPGYLADRIFDGRFDVVHLKGRSVRPAMEWRQK